MPQLFVPNTAPGGSIRKNIDQAIFGGYTRKTPVGFCLKSSMLNTLKKNDSIISQQQHRVYMYS